MTADARQQAEQIVDRIDRGAKAADACMRSADNEPEVVRQVAERYLSDRPRLASALAAAIELVEDAHSGEPASWEVVQERYRKMAALREALSALGVEVDGARPHSGDSAKEDSDGDS